MELREEELRARNTSVEASQVTLGKHVVEERQAFEVLVTRETAFVERRRVNRATHRPIEAGADQTIEVPIRQKRVQLEKAAGGR